MATWLPPPAGGSLGGSVTVPGSKSMTNRALVLGALAVGPGRLRTPLRSRDTELMAAALRALGVEITDDGPDWVVNPQPLSGPARVDVGLAGTVLRFVPAIATLARGTVAFDGDPRARERPVMALLHALRALGADVTGDGLPFAVTGRGGLHGGNVSLDASPSSQLVSALLLAAARWDVGVVVRHTGAVRVPNTPHLTMTLSMLRDRGVAAEQPDDRTWTVAAGSIRAADEAIEPDLSSAAPFLAGAVVTGGSVTVAGWPATSTQPGARLPDLLGAFGATNARDGSALRLTGPSRVRGTDLDLRDVGELTPVLAAVATVADGPSTLRGVDYLRGHETDRLAALATELTRLGAGVTELSDGLRIEPRPLRAARWRTYDDHRLAMAAAVLALVVPGLEVENPATTGKTFPGFVNTWERFVLGADH